MPNELLLPPDRDAETFLADEPDLKLDCWEDMASPAGFLPFLFRKIFSRFE